MLKKFVLAFAILALVAAIAGTAPSVGNTYRITLLQNSVVKGTELKAGDYRLNVGPEKVTLANGQLSVDMPAKIETVDKKFDVTSIRYTLKDGKQSIAEIRIGGTKTCVQMNP